MTFNIYLGQGGVGKSTTLKHIALQWASEKEKQLLKFAFVYHIALKHVKPGQTIPELIVKQHKLQALGVMKQEIQATLDASAQQQVRNILLRIANLTLYVIRSYFLPNQ